MRKTTLLLIIGLIFAVLMFTGCNKLENQTTSASKLILDMITGNDIEGNAGSNTIFSDVITTSGGIFNDNADATMRAVLLDPGAVESTFYQTIIVDRIFVEFSRSDGKNEQGKDIPYSFFQDVNVSIDIDEQVIFPFVLVQHTAKMESPLKELRYSSEVYKFEAKVTFYGKDVAGRRVEEISGSVSVWFANFADEN